jgi:cysteine/O-acetylserine efflux protein
MKDLIPLLTYIFVVVYTPGPNNIMSMVNGMQLGYKKTLRFLLGVSSGFLIITSAGGLLNLFLSNMLPSSEKWMKILSAIYMLYLAYHIIRSGPIEETGKESVTAKYRFGFSMQFLNIKGILFSISVFAMFVNDFSANLLNVLLFALFLTAVAFSATTAWALGGSIFRRLAQKYYKVFNYVMGGLLIYTAIAGLV